MISQAGPAAPTAGSACRSRIGLIMLVAATLATSCWSLLAVAATDLLIVLSSDAAPYRELAQSTTDEATRANPGIASQIVGTKDLARVASEAQVIVAVGTQAAQAVAALKPNVPVINTLLPEASVQRLPRAATSESGKLSAVVLDQPAARYLDLLRAAAPERNRVAVLLGPDSETELAALQTAAARRRMRIAHATVRSEREIHAALASLLPESDALLALPDSLIYNNSTLPYILLTAYHAQVPIVGFSPAYVTAGAMLAVYSTPAQLGRQCAELVRRALAGDPLPPPQRPRDYEVGGNAHVARSLGIDLEPPDVIKDRMQRGGARR